MSVDTESKPAALPLPPGPSGFSGPFYLWRDPLGFFLHLVTQYGDIAYHHGVPNFIVVNHPDYIKHVLLNTNKTYNKDLFDYKVLKQTLGEGLVTSDNPLWQRQRKLIQPVFHRKAIEGFGRLMGDASIAKANEWQAAIVEERALDISHEMMHLTLEIVGKALFGTEVRDADAETISKALEVINIMPFSVNGILSTMPWLPVPSNLRFRAELAKLDEVVFRIIDQRRREGGQHEDLLSMLLHAQHEDTGEGMSDKQLRDEVMTLLLAGYETTANALNWTWYLLAQNPKIEERLYEEVFAALQGQAPSVEDLPRVPYARMVIEESMRILPPVWGIARMALVDDEIGGYKVPARTPVFITPYTMHRHPKFWDNPEKFDPERFSPAQTEKRHPYAYCPFGGGPRICIGNHFAMMEAQIVLCTMIQRFRLELVAGHQVEPEARVTLRPKNGLMMRPVLRSKA